jgi:thiol-disulfide isomerase/thioredoxin
MVVSTAAEADLERMHAALVSPAALRVSVAKTMKRGQQELSLDETMDIGPADRFDWTGTGFRMTVEDGQLRGLLGQVDDRVIDVPTSGATLAESVRQALGDYGSLPPELLMRTDAAWREWADLLFGDVLGTPVRPTARVEEEGEIHITFEGPIGFGFLRIDPTTMFPLAAEGSGTRIDGPVQTPVRMVSKYAISPIGTSDLAPGIPLGGRTTVPDVAGLLTATSDRPHVDPGEPMPAFSMPSSDGGVVDSQSLAGKWVVVDFWASWCTPCKQGLPEIQRLWEATGRNGGDVRIYAVNVLDGAGPAEPRLDRIRTYWEKAGYGFPSLLAVDADDVREWGLLGIPVTVLVNPEGVVVSRADGYTPGEWKHLLKIIEGGEPDHGS